jgi:Uncharacterized conserved protein
MEYKTDKRIVTIHAIQGLVIIIAMIFLILLLSLLFKETNVLFRMLSGMVIFISLLTSYEALIYMPLAYKKNRISIDKNFVVIQKGLFIKTLVKMPISKLYTVKLVQGPFEKVFNTKNIVLVTLADEFTMPVLNSRYTDVLSRRLIRAIKDNDKK